MDQLQDLSNREDGIMVQKHGTPEDCNIFQMLEFKDLLINPHESSMRHIFNIVVGITARSPRISSLFIPESFFLSKSS
ncbi:hypothetical protein OXIME_000108 [Oxyplasma meridianum]|uniref:Uncharacterized protein n=1 Tax=Oxyplasma meridianum TaxID=3073602 RepID=A0AAX4NFU2_9ARCH